MSFQQDLFDSINIHSKPEVDEVLISDHQKRKFIPWDRNQIEFRIESLDSALPLNHDARTVWNFVKLLDVTKAEIAISSLSGCSGRPAIHPRILIALWIYGISRGIVSGRKIAENCKDHRGFRWICAGVSVGHHVLSGFRSKHSELFEDLVVQSIALLVSKDLIQLKEVSQDGVRVKAHASKQSLRRKTTLKEKVSEIKKHLKHLEDQMKKGELNKEEQRKKERELIEARKKEKSIEEAFKELENYKKQKNDNRLKHRKKKLSNKEVSDLRASTTDAECRKMRMADGSFQSAYNVQITTEINSELAVGARVSQNGTDGGEMLLMYKHLQEKYKAVIDSYVVDDGFKNLNDLKELWKQGTHVYMPTNGKSKSLREKVLRGNDRGVTDVEKEWVNRMETDDAKELYNKRMRVSETINAYFRNHGLGQLLVKGIEKTLGVINLYCLAYNMTIIKRCYRLI